MCIYIYIHTYVYIYIYITMTITSSKYTTTDMTGLDLDELRAVRKPSPDSRK